jgi:hypothetical protein
MSLLSNGGIGYLPLCYCIPIFLLPSKFGKAQYKYLNKQKITDCLMFIQTIHCMFQNSVSNNCANFKWSGFNNKITITIKQMFQFYNQPHIVTKVSNKSHICLLHLCLSMLTNFLPSYDSVLSAVWQVHVHILSP